MTRARKTIVALGLAGLAGGGAALGIGALRAQEDQGVLARVISNALSTPTQQISIGAVQGALSSQATILDVRISDEDGVWLSLDRATIDWDRSALLFRRRLDVTELSLGTLTIERLPASEEQPQGEVVEGPLVPEIPLEIEVGRFALEELVLGEPVLGTAARLGAEGSARIGAPAEGISLDFTAERLDQPGAFGAEIAYRPVENTLTLDVSLDEPAGGLVARLLELPGLPPVTLALQGEGPLENFAATLDFAAGETIGAEGRATVNGTGDGYALDLDLAAQISGLLPEAVAPVFEGTTQLAGNVTIGNRGRVVVDGLRLETTTAILAVDGSIGEEGAVALDVTGRALPTQGGVTEAGAARIGTLELDLSVAGSLTAPRIDGTVLARDVATPRLSFDSLDFTVDSAPVGDQDPPDRFSFAVDAAAAGLAFVDPALQDAIGATLSVVARGEVTTEGIATVETAAIETNTASASFAGTVGPQTLGGRLEASIPDLSALSRLVGTDLAGRAEVGAGLAGDPSAPFVVADLDGALTGFASGIEALDGLLGDSVALDGTAQLVPGGFALTNLSLDGANLTLIADGRATDEAADLRLDLTVPMLAPLDPRVDAGRLTAQARLTGSLERPDVTADVALRDVVAMDRPIERLDLRLVGTDLTGALDARIALSGLVAGEQAEGTARVQRMDTGGWDVSGLDLTIGSVDVAGALSLGDAGLAAGSIRIDAQDLSDLEPLLLTEIAGALDADVSLAVVDGGQNATIVAEGAALAFGETRVSDFSVDLGVVDLYRAPVVDGTLEASAVTAGGQTFERVRLAFDGTPDATAFTAVALAQGFDLDARGRIVPRDDEAIRVTLEAFRATRDGRTVQLADEASVTLAGRTISIDGLRLETQGGAVAVDGTVGDTLALDAVIESLPLSVAEIFVPDLGISGIADGTVSLSGTTSAPQGEYDLTVTGFSLPQLREAGLDSVSLAAEGDFTGERATVDATIEAGGGRIAVVGSVPLSADGAVDLDVTATDLPLALARTVAPDLDPAGRLSATVALGGTLSAPTGDYTLSVEDLTVAQTRAAGLGAIAASATGRLDTQRATVDAVLTANGGRITAVGSVPLDPAGAIDLEVTATDLPLALARAAAPDLDISGRLSATASLGGTFAAPTGPYTLRIDDLALAQTRNAGIDAIDVTASGTLTGDRAGIDATIAAAPLGTLSASGSIPLGATGAIDLSVSGPVTLDPLSRFLGPGQQAAGQATIDLDIGGTFANPQVTGGATLQGASFRDDLNGIALSNITGSVEAVGDSVRIATLTATTPNGGSLSVAGTVGLGAGFPADLTITGRNAQLVESDFLVARADLDLRITGPVATAPTIAGNVSLLSLDVTIPESLPTTLEPLPGTRHVAPPPQAAARLALARERAARQAAGGAAPFEARLDLTVEALNQIFVRGRGVDAELGGALTLTGTTRAPEAIGAFDLRRGRLDILGQRLDFTRGRLAFAGSLTPDLDFEAQTQAGDVTAIVAVRGPANQPRFELSSTPDLPEDEILSRVLFGRAAGGLSAAQALQLAQGLASLAGGGSGVFEQIRRSLGVDSLDISAGEGGPTVGVGRYIADNVRLGLRAGARPDDTGVTVDIDLSDRLRLQGAVGADGRSSVGVGYEIEY